MSPAKYTRIHRWVARHHGKPRKCDDCGVTDKREKGIDWANISGKYLAIRSDWKRLCKPCHRIFDKHIKLNEKQIRVMKWANFYGAPQPYLAKIFRINQSTVSRILAGLRRQRVVTT